MTRTRRLDPLIIGRVVWSSTPAAVQRRSLPCERPRRRFTNSSSCTTTVDTTNKASSSSPNHDPTDATATSTTTPLDQEQEHPATTSTPTTTTTITTTPDHHNTNNSWYYQLQQTIQSWTGVDEISALKQAVAVTSDEWHHQTARVQHWKLQLQQNTAHHQTLARQHAAVLHHRESWSSADIQEFARLTAAEAVARATVEQQQQQLQQQEVSLHTAQLAYMDALRKRYQEEQIWQDKWRILGTYWTWILIALNTTVFVVGQYLHYRREEVRMLKLQDVLQDFQTNVTGSLTTLYDTTNPNNSAARTSSSVDSLMIKGAVENQQESSPRALTNQDDKNTTATSEEETSIAPQEDTTTTTTTGSNDNIVDWKHAGRNGPLAMAVTWWRPTKRLLYEQQHPDVGSSATTTRQWLHWPSVAAGAVMGSLGILLVSSLRRRH